MISDFAQNIDYFTKALCTYMTCMNDTSIYYLFEQILGSSSVIELTDFFWNINVYRLEY